MVVGTSDGGMTILNCATPFEQTHGCKSVAVAAGFEALTTAVLITNPLVVGNGATDGTVPSGGPIYVAALALSTVEVP